MARFCFCLLVVAAFVTASAGRSQAQAPPSQSAIGKVYSLADLDDPNLCKWVIEAIPRMIKPGGWNAQDLSYYAPAKMLAIHQAPDVHAQIEEFLANVRKSVKRSTHNGMVTQAQHVPNALPVRPTSAGFAAPKHLFHFIIRHEGVGKIDSNVQRLSEAIRNAGPLMLINQYSSDPVTRMEQLMIDSENLREIHNEWRQFWQNDQPSHVTPYRIHGGIGPASSSI